MTPAKVNVFFAFFPYGGNGGISNEHPSIRAWFARTLAQVKKDERIDRVSSMDFSDTPITMTRNDAVLTAMADGADVMVMCDSDQIPDLYVDDPKAKPFWNSTFDFLYQRKMEGKMTVVGAPYCGPPPHECVYVFEWCAYQSEHPGIDFRLAMVSRENAAIRSGIQQAAALPTGLIMFDLGVFRHCDPAKEYERHIRGGASVQVAKALTKPWFYYEWENVYAAKKASTEDVTATRDIGMMIKEDLGYDPIFCNWDAWAGHVKPKVVGKPVNITLDQINSRYRQAVLAKVNEGDRLIDVATLNNPGVLEKIRGSVKQGEKDASKSRETI